jgi:hypothetical protein
MLNASNLGFLPNADPTNARAVEALYTLLNDVEQRLQIVKASLTQTLPGISGLGVGMGTPGFGQGIPQGFPNLSPGFPQSFPQGFPQSQGGYHAFVPTPLGMVPVFIPTSTPGVGWPSGVGSQQGFSGTPFGNFRA